MRCLCQSENFETKTLFLQKTKQKSDFDARQWPAINALVAVLFILLADAKLRGSVIWKLCSAFPLPPNSQLRSFCH